MLEIRNIEKSFGSQTALAKLDLTIEQGEFFSLLGPSGCGKSTLLRIIAGLESADSGEILWKGKRIDQMPARERPFNMVFQKYALFPHLSVADNVAFGLRLQKLAAREIEERVRESLALVNLSGFEKRYPDTLSGGQAQRVALARALANRPQCILLDEPLTALDEKLRERMQSELRLLQQRLGLTFIFVTHDQEEALLLSDRIAVMNGGKVEQVSTPRELYEAPKSVFCARFVGRRNEISVHGLGLDGASIALNFEGGETDQQVSLRGRAICRDLGERGLGQVHAFVRPEKLRVKAANILPTVGQNRLIGEVIQVVFRGVNTEVVVALSGGNFVRSIMENDGAMIEVGDQVAVEFSPEETHVFSGPPSEASQPTLDQPQSLE